MKKSVMLLIIYLSAVILLVACSPEKVAEPVILPALDDVDSISVTSGDINATSINKEWLSEVMSILMDMEPTSIPSINDSPNVEEYTMINVNCSDGTVKTIFFYEEKGKEYVEQPYQGIYMPAPALGVKITELLESLDK